MNYIGSKNRLSKELVPIIQSYIDNMPNCNGYLEPFVGGANVIDKIKCENKYGSDIHCPRPLQRVLAKKALTCHRALL